MNPVLNIEFDLVKGEFKPVQMDAVKDLPFDKLYFAFEILQQWLMAQHLQKGMQQAMKAQASKIQMATADQIPPRNIFSP